MSRIYLYEAANVVLTRIAQWSALKSWGIRIAKRGSLRKAKVARRHSAPHVGRRHRVQPVIKGGSCPRRIIEKTSFRPQAGLRSLPGRGGGEIALGLAMLERAKRASHIESTSVTLCHHAEACPYR